MKNIRFLCGAIFCILALCAFAGWELNRNFPLPPDREDSFREAADLTLHAADNVRDRLLARHDWIEGSRHVLGMAREVLMLIADVNEAASAKMPANGVLQGTVEKGDTIAGILEEAGNGRVQSFVNAAAKVFPLRSFKAGQLYTVITDPATGQLKRFEYDVNDRHRLVVEGADKPQARLEEIEYVTLLETADGVIEENLFQAVADIGESPQLALRLVDLFGSEINFIKDLQPGDKFSVLLEKRFRDGEYKGYGRILAAKFTNRGKTFEAFLFRDGEGRLQHYNARGENLKKTLLMAPLAVTRLTSRFSHSRKHPILGKTRPHLGVDYGAPTGTPVKAVGSGVVTSRGWNGGYGNQIVIKHDAGLESMYAHLSGYARGLAKGKRVRQGQVIGFVGSTGLSTGPHLDFRLRQNGVFINPVKAINPRGAPVESRLQPAFRRARELATSYLEGGKLPENYNVNSIIPAFHPEIKQSTPPKRNKKPVRAKNRGVKRG